MSVLNFFKKFQENSLLTDVNLRLQNYIKEDILLQVLTHLVPLINSIDSITIVTSKVDLFKMVYNNNNGDEKTHQLLLMMMAKTRIMWPIWLHIFIILFCILFMIFVFLSTGKSFAMTLNTRGKIKWIGAALGLTHREMMGNHE
jgi:hypothetical protein